MFPESYLDRVSEVASSGSKWRIIVPSSWQLFSFGAEELDEVEEAAQSEAPERTSEEIGDLLFAIVNLARWLNVDAEESLRKASDKCVGRFRGMEADLEARGGPPRPAAC